MTDAERIAELEDELAYLRSELGMVRSAERLQRLRDVLRLTGSEARLLLRLYNARGMIVAHDQLAEELGEDADPRSLKTHISRIRHRGGFPWINTIWGVGYRMTREGLAEASRILADEQLRAA